jgi:hypothetical protein
MILRCSKSVPLFRIRSRSPLVNLSNSFGPSASPLRGPYRFITVINSQEVFKSNSVDLSTQTNETQQTRWQCHIYFSFTDALFNKLFACSWLFLLAWVTLLGTSISLYWRASVTKVKMFITLTPVVAAKKSQNPRYTRSQSYNFFFSE